MWEERGPKWPLWKGSHALVRLSPGNGRRPEPKAGGSQPHSQARGAAGQPGAPGL